MTFVLADRVKETSTTTGTGTYSLAGAVRGYQTFVAGVGSTNTCYYLAHAIDYDKWEIGIGTVTDAATDTLARTTVLRSSNSNAAVSWDTGPKVIETIYKSHAHVDVTNYGATGNGTTDDTTAVAAAIAASVGEPIYFPSGTYVLENLAISSNVCLVLSDEATLKHKAAASDVMISSTADRLVITGGSVDGNKDNQTSRLRCIQAACQTTKRVEIRDVRFSNTVFSGIGVISQGGTVVIENCDFQDMEPHSGSVGEQTQAIHITSTSETDAGHIRIVGCTMAADAEDTTGREPGGVIISSYGSSVLIKDCLFDGVGQSAGGNHIGAVDIYQRCDGVRIENNTFQNCRYIEIKVQNSSNIVITGNVVKDGSATKVLGSEVGSIWVTPLIRSWPATENRILVANNIIDDSGELTGSNGPCNGIYVQGDNSDQAVQVIISGNIVSDVGVGIIVYAIEDVVICGNTVRTCNDRSYDSTEGTGVYISGTTIGKKATVVGNNIAEIDGNGIICEAEHAIIKGNQILNVGQGAIGAQSGITIHDSTTAIIEGNDILDEQGTATMLYGIAVYSPAVAECNGNRISGAVTGNILDAGAGLTTTVGGGGPVTFSVGTALTQVMALTTTQRAGIGGTPTSTAGKLHVDQSSTSGAIPVLVLDQADVDEDFIKIIGTSDANVDRALVDAADFTTPGAIAGWLKIYVQDDAASDGITDGDFFIPFYAAPSA